MAGGLDGFQFRNYNQRKTIQGSVGVIEIQVIEIHVF